jgi:hypothetical protein
MNKESLRRLLWAGIFGITMGFFEAAVVTYLREIFYPQGFEFPITTATMDENILAVEVAREFMSLLMLLAVSILAGRNRLERFFFFLCSFGVWDIFYYLFLYIILGWPPSLLTWDILFLIPLMWVGPVWAPIGISLLFIISTILILYQQDRGQALRLTLLEWLFIAVAGLIIILSFTLEGLKVMAGNMPPPYRWWMWLAGVVILVIVFIRALQRSKL